MSEWTWLQRMEIGARRQLLVRRENVTHLGLSKRILFASDLHLKKDGPRQVVAGILDIVSSERPDVVLLGGDLVDWRSGLEPLHRLVADMSVMAPVAAVGGNHDRWIGLAQVREAVLEAGGHWLEDRPLRWAPNAVAYGNPQQELWSAALSGSLYPPSGPAGCTPGLRSYPQRALTWWPVRLLRAWRKVISRCVRVSMERIAISGKRPHTPGQSRSEGYSSLALELPTRSDRCGSLGDCRNREMRQRQIQSARIPVAPAPTDNPETKK